MISTAEIKKISQPFSNYFGGACNLPFPSFLSNTCLQKPPQLSLSLSLSLSLQLSLSPKSPLILDQNTSIVVPIPEVIFTLNARITLMLKFMLILCLFQMGLFCFRHFLLLLWKQWMPHCLFANLSPQLL